METTARKTEECSVIPGVEARGTTTACNEIGMQENMNVAATFDCPPVGARTDCALCPVGVKRRCILPVIDAERMNESIRMVAQLRGRAA